MISFEMKALCTCTCHKDIRTVSLFELTASCQLAQAIAIHCLTVLGFFFLFCRSRLLKTQDKTACHKKDSSILSIFSRMVLCLSIFL